VSITVGYYFNAAHSLSDLGDLLGRVLGVRFAPYEGDPSDLFCRLFSLEASLSIHSLDDDRDLEFTAFRYVLDTRTPVPDADFRDLQLGIMATLPALLHRRAGIVDGMLVYDVQRLLARYELRHDEFFDTVSAQPVHFPSHIRHVFERANVA
jgi:hypothetical protein